MSALGVGAAVMGSFPHYGSDLCGGVGAGGQVSLERDPAGMEPWPSQGEELLLVAIWAVDDWGHLEQAVWLGQVLDGLEQ